MAKFEVTKGKAVKSYSKQTSEPIFYEVGEVVEAEKMPSLLVGKCRELVEKPKKQRLTTQTETRLVRVFYCLDQIFIAPCTQTLHHF